MDVCKIRPGIYQYTALDDCSRYKVLRLYDRASASSTLDFLNHVVEESPFAIQRIQTDRGREFFAEAVQQRLMDWAIKFRPIAPRSPHLNGKVERTHRADREGLWDTVDLMGSRHRDEAGRVAASLELASAPYGAGRPFTHRPGLRTDRQDAPLGNRRGCIRPHTRAHQDRRLSPRQNSR